MSDVLLTDYHGARSRFLDGAAGSGARSERHPLEARGPDGNELSIDVAVVGAERPEQVLFVLSGTHGVEGFIGSAMQVDLLGRLDPRVMPAALRVVLIHAVNPWGMAWHRRANESNVDLNRNWDRDHCDPPANPGYGEVHSFLCPSSDTIPTDASFLEPAAALVEERGLAWVRDAVSIGQYTHSDGLHFGGNRTEESTTILSELIRRLGAGAAESFCVDLHTGHGPIGAATILSDAAPGTKGDRWLRAHFDPAIIEATVDNPAATTGNKVGQLGHGFADVLPGAHHRSMTLEIGTEDDVAIVLAGRTENWVHHHGDRASPEGRAAIEANLRCYTPDDPAWVQQALGHGRALLDQAIAAMANES